MLRGLFAGGLAVLLFTSAPGHAQERECTLALVLAVDVSGSVDEHEYHLQMQGLADAFRSEDIIDAVNADGKGGIMATVIQWSGDTRQRQIVPWAWLTDRASLDRFAEAILASTRAYRIYSTGIGEALAFSGTTFLQVTRDCRRKVVDVSGDGPSNEGRAPANIRNALVARGVVVNGLAILESEPTLADYYRAHVIGGAASFVMSANRFEDYPEAIRRKLLREILPPVVLNTEEPTTLTR